MASVELSYRATEYDLQNKSSREVMLVGEAFLTGVAPGHPLPPDTGPVDPGYGVPIPPTVIWGGRPGPWGGSWVPPQPQPPLPPDFTPPQPGEPPVALPTPGGGTPVNPIVPPPWIPVNYPGVGWIAVAPPAPAS